MFRNFHAHAVRVIFLVFVCALTGATRCSSAQLTKEAERQQEQNARAKTIVARYMPHSKDRDEVFSALDNSSQLIEEQSRQNTRLIEKNDALRKYRNYFFAALMSVALIFFLYLRMK